MDYLLPSLFPFWRRRHETDAVISKNLRIGSGHATGTQKVSHLAIMRVILNPYAGSRRNR